MNLAFRQAAAIAQRISQMSGQVLQVGQRARHPSLHKLEQNGWISAKWATSDKNRRANYYTLTSTVAAYSLTFTDGAGRA